MDAVSLAGVSSVGAASSPCCWEARVVLPGLLLWFTLLPSGLEQLLVQTVRGSRLSVMEAFGRISSSTLPPRRAIRTWKFGLCLRPRFFQSFWCLGVACGVRRIFGTRALLGSTVDTCFTEGYWRTSRIFSVR